MNWHEMNQAIREMNETELKQMLAQELRRRQPRGSFLIRIHQRYCALRDARERAELLAQLA